MLADYDKNIEIKDSIQEMLRTESLTFSEIFMRLDVEKSALKNFINTLKYMNLIEYDPNFPWTKRGNGKYRAVADGMQYSVKHMAARTARSVNYLATQTEVSPYATMTCNSNKYHTRPAQRPSSSAWAGYGSLA